MIHGQETLEVGMTRPAGLGMSGTLCQWLNGCKLAVGFFCAKAAAS